MPVSTNLIRRKLREKLLTVAGIPPVDRRAWENDNFNPGTDLTAPWIRETLIPGLEAPLATGLLEAVGIVQFDLFAPKGNRTASYEPVRDAIKAVFEPGTNIALGNGHNIGIVSVTPLVIPSDDNWAGFPVQIQWQAFGDRS